MAAANSVSDTQVLLQSMLQRLKLQPKPENNNTHTRNEVQYNTTLIEKNGGAAESPPQTPPMYNFNFTMDSKSIVTNLPEPPSPGLGGVPMSHSQEFAKGIDAHNLKLSSTLKEDALSWRFTSRPTIFGQNSDVSTRVDDGITPKQTKKHKFFPKMNYSSVSSQQSVERSFSSWSQMDANIQDQGDRQMKWTRKVKEKWRERHKSTPMTEQDNKKKQEQSNVKNSIRSPIPLQTMFNENNTTTGFNEEVRVQLQPISDGPVENTPSLLDLMSKPLLSLGSFNLMEEIFTGQEWAKFLPSSTNSNSASSLILQDPGITHCFNQPQQNDPSQWNYTAATSPNLAMTQLQIKPGSFLTMDTSENILNQTKTSRHSIPKVQNGQYGVSVSESNHLESMDQSPSPLGRNYPISAGHVYPYNHSNTTEHNNILLLSNVESGNEIKATERYRNHYEGAHEVLPVLDLTYLQSKDGASLKKQVFLNRKRSYTTERGGSNEPWRSAPEEMHEWRQNSSHSAPSLSPASSTSSLQHSLSQESESSFSTETVIKKRRVEDTRHVRFSEEVTIVPPLILYDDDDGDADDEDYGHNSNEGSGEAVEELASPPSVPRWIEALRSKTKRKPNVKLPRMRSRKYHFM